MTVETTNVDIENCAREPIHLLGRIQTFGCLLACTSDMNIAHASENLGDFLSVSAVGAIGAPVAKILSSEAMDALRARMPLLHGQDAIARMFNVRADPLSDRRFDIAAHVSGRLIVIELERSSSLDPRNQLGFVQPMIARAASARRLEEVCDIAARQVKTLTGFDRVMVYRFNRDESGEVIAEARESGIGSFLGLRFPSSDIPAQARALYRRNLLRIIANVDGATAAVTPAFSPEGRPLDLSLSGLRAVSSIHLEYLRNMGVAASLSISIIRRGKLWGLFACHHYSPRVLAYDVRSSAELFGQMFGFVLDQIEAEDARVHALKARAAHNRVMAQLTGAQSLVDEFGAIAVAMQAAIRCDGVAASINGNIRTTGLTPNENDIVGLVEFLNAAGGGEIYSSEHLGFVYPPARDFVARAAGVLAIPVSRRPRDQILLFRQEAARHVRWAGDPRKPAELGPNGPRLTPRKSFEAWKETVTGVCDPWLESEIELATSFRITLIEVVLRLTDAASEERARLIERQDLLIAELNHRVRNILNLIKGLISQSRSETRTPSQFTEIIGGRIHSLARAHDQITRKNWTGSSLRELLQTEFDAFLGEKAARATINGPDFKLAPAALSTLSLVFHELATNAMKHGALKNESGRIMIDFRSSQDGSLIIRWTETDGPHVIAPLRRGFGSAIIERSVPFELKGEARVDYLGSGLQAEYVVPARFVETMAADGAGGGASRAPGAANAGTIKPEALASAALIVEDNIIIAMEAEDILRALGFDDIHVAASVDQAMRVIGSNTLGAAMLDLNLGGETSEEIAIALTANGTPFIYATGYGDSDATMSRMPKAPFVTKPYDRDAVAAALAQAMESGQR